MSINKYVYITNVLVQRRFILMINANFGAIVNSSLLFAQGDSTPKQVAGNLAHKNIL
jgi:hypothetical protein